MHKISAKKSSIFQPDRQGIICLLIALVVAILSYYQTAGFPYNPNTDAMAFLPSAISYAKGQGLRNAFMSSPWLLDGRHIWHGFLLPLVLGGVFKTDTYVKISHILAFINAGTIILLALSLIKLTATWRGFSRYYFLGTCLLAQAGFLLGILGRPETMLTLFVAGGMFIWTFKLSRLSCIGLGILLGVAATTSPIPSIFLGLFVLIGLLSRASNSIRLIQYMVIILLSALLTFLTCFIFYPYSLTEWVNGLLMTSKVVYSMPSLTIDRAIKEKFIYTGRFLSGPVFTCGLAIGFISLWYRRKIVPRARIYIAFVLSIFLTAALLTQQFYYLLSTFPVVACIIAHYASNDGLNPLLRKFYIFIFFLLGISALDPLLLQASNAMRAQNMSLVMARQQFSNERKNMPGTIALSMNLTPLTEDTHDTTILFEYNPPIKEPQTDWLVIKQDFQNSEGPPTYKHFTLWKSNFSKPNNFPRRINQWFEQHGYNFAIYRRTP